MAVEGVSRGLHHIRMKSLEKHEVGHFINDSVYTEGIIKDAEFMLDAEKRTVKLYRSFHKLDK